MGHKLSPHKVGRIIALYFEGASEIHIAHKLKISQGAVSAYVGKFKTLVAEEGIHSAEKEYGVTDQVEALRSLALDLKKAGLTVDETKGGLKVELLFKHLGVKPGDYPGLMEACAKLESKGLVDSALKLNQLEKSTGMAYADIISHGSATHAKLLAEQQNLQAKGQDLEVGKKELADIGKQKKLAGEDLQAYLKQVGADMGRIKLVEGLALALKKAGVSDKELDDFIDRLQVLDKAGISPGTFVSIVEKAKIMTSHDGGEELLQSLLAYGGLTNSVKVWQAKVKLLEAEGAGREKLAQLKGKLDVETAELKDEKASLESSVTELGARKDELHQTQGLMDSLKKEKAGLEQETVKLKDREGALIDSIKTKEQKVSDLEKLEAKHDALLASVSKIETKLDHETARMQIFESFLGVVASTSVAEVEKFIATLPGLLDQVKLGKNSPDLLMALVFKTLTGDALQVLKCKACGVRFSADMPPTTHGYTIQGYHCPRCNSSITVVDKDLPAILKAALAKLKPQVIVATQEAKQPKPDNANPGKAEDSTVSSEITKGIGA